LILAIAQGKEEAAKLLLENGSDRSIPDKGGWTALAWAKALRRDHIVKLLEDGEEWPRSWRISPLGIAVRSGGERY